MEEHKDKDASGGNVQESSKDVASDHVASRDSEKIRAVEPASSEVQDASQKSSTEGVAERGRSCSEADTTVGVMASDMHVDGVGVDVAGDDGGGRLSQVGTNGLGKSVEMGAERDTKDLVGGVDESCKETLNLGTKGEVGMSCGVAESKEQKLVDGHATIGKINDVARSDAGIGDAQEMAVDISVEVPAGEENKAVVENVAVATGEESLRGGSGSEYFARGGINVTKDRVLEKEIQDERVENGVRDSLAVIGPSVGETQASTLEKPEPTEEAADKAEETNGNGENACKESETEKLSVLRDEVSNPGIETSVAPSSTVSEDSNVKTQVAEEEAMVMVNDDTLNSKSEAALEKHGIDAVDGGISCSTRATDSTENYAIANTTSESLGGHTQVAVGGKVASVDKDITHGADLEEKHSSDVVEGGTSSSENNSDSTKKYAIVNTISTSLDGHSQNVVDGKVASTDNKDITCGAGMKEKHGSDVVEGGISSSDKDSDLTQKDASTNTISKQLDGHTKVAVDGKVASMDNEDITCPNIEGMDTDAFNENFCFSVEELQATVETANGSTENHYDAFADSRSLQQPTQLVVGGDVAAEIKKLLNPEKDRKLIVGEIPSQSMSGDSSQVHSTVEPEMGVDKPVTDIELAGLKKEKDEVKTANKTTGNDQELKLEVSLDESAASSPPQVATNIGQLMGSQEQVSHVDKLGGSEKKVVGQDSEAEKVSTSTDTDSSVVDGRQSASVNCVDVPEKGDHHQKIKEGMDKVAGCDVSEIESDVGTQTAIDERVPDSEKVGFHEGREMEVEEQDSDSEEPKTTEEKHAKQAALNPGSTIKAHQATYELPPDDEAEFAVSDLVWGKVRSHPWWPGQIFDPSDASEKAMKYNKKDCFFVAYFGDRTFAWNDASVLKPFRSHFSQVEKQSNSETFQNAVNCALEEFSRRIEVGLACACMPSNTYDKIKCQIVENTGVRQESSVREGTDKSLGTDLFEPVKLVKYMKALAQSPTGVADRLDLVIARSQLLSFYRLKGYSQLPEFQFCAGWSENADALQSEGELISDTFPVYMDAKQISYGQEVLQTQSSYHKRKHNLKDTIYPRKKEKSLTEIMEEPWDSVDDEIGLDGKANNKLASPSSGKKRRGPDSFADDSATLEGRKTISLAKVSASVKPSFKIGECIRRVASQMTGSPSILKSNSQKVDGSSEGLVGDGSDFQHSEDTEMKRSAVPTEYSSLDELLSQLYLAASDPSKGYSFLTVIVSFFSDFRNAVIMEQHEKVGGKRRQPIGGFPETFEFEDMNDTYWTDRVIQNGSEEQPPRKSRRRDNQVALVDSDKSLNRSNSRKRYSDGNRGLSAEKPVDYVDENAPAELIMHFPVVDSVPSETSLIKMFKRFGPLKESETEIDKPTNRARVVFKKCSDAEAAYGSATKFNIFGSMLVNYQLNYSITVPFKTEPSVMLPGEEDATVFLQY